jgi:tetratricopeptide (TPR) repeat protein
MPPNDLLQDALQAQQSGQLSIALGLYEQVIDQDPLAFIAWSNGASIALEIGAPELTELSWSWAQQAVRLRPRDSWAQYVLGLACQKAGRHDEAVQAYRLAIQENETFYQAYTNLGVAYSALRDFESAQLSLERAIDLKPDNDVAWNNLGVTLKSMGQPEQALACYDRAIALNALYLDAWVNRGFAKSECMQIESAQSDYERALELDPQSAPAQFNLSLLHLMLGRLEEGWLGYEARHRLMGSETASYSDILTQWPSSVDLGLLARTHRSQHDEWPWIEVVAEQGFGDVLQFCRYVPLLADLGWRVRLKAPEALLVLLQSLRGVEVLDVLDGIEGPIEAQGENPGPHWNSLPLMSLPRLMGTRMESIPASIPYLHPLAERVLFFEREVQVCLAKAFGQPPRRALRVGLVWSGGFRPDMPQTWGLNARRNIPLKEWEPLGLIDAHFFSLQLGEAAKQELMTLQSMGWKGPNLHDLTPALSHFADTAALMMQLDLILSVDTSCAHLAAALGKEVWILNRYDACWRWLLGQERSPWYPSAKLYRQERANDWSSVLHRVFTDLEAKVSSFGAKV